MLLKIVFIFSYNYYILRWIFLYFILIINGEVFMVTDNKKVEDEQGVFISLKDYNNYLKLLEAFKRFNRLKERYKLFYDL